MILSANQGPRGGLISLDLTASSSNATAVDHPSQKVPRFFPFGRKTVATLALASAGVASLDHFVVHSDDLQFPKEIPVAMRGPKVVQGPATKLFAGPRDLSHSEVELKVKTPPIWEGKNVAVVGVQALDSSLRSQTTGWAEGQLTSENPNYEAKSHTLSIHYRPSTVEVDEHRHTDEGFDPTHVLSLRLMVSNESSQSAPLALLQIEESKLVGHQPRLQTADLRPLLNEGHSHEHPPLAPNQVIGGVSRYFEYADLNHWAKVRGKVDAALSAQQVHGFHGFRFMGGLSIKSHTRLDAAVFSAMREFLDMCRTHHQDRLVFTLIDGAVPNSVLWGALQDPCQRQELVETLRPFIQEFGNAKVNGEPVIFDVVNEIEGAPGTLASKQQLIHDIADLFVQEAPGAKLTVGAQNYRSLKDWTHLPERYQGQPIEFMMSFHLYEDVDNLPDASQLNLPAHMQVAITEADPTKNMAEIVRKSAAKGYEWLLFWTDSKMPYQPATHRNCLK